MTKERLLFVDFAKTIAIILMVILHSSYKYPSFNNYVGAFHMAVFFFAAGLFAKGKDVSTKKVIKNSFVQLIIPYFAFSIIALSYGWIYAYLHPVLYRTNGEFADILQKELIGILLMRDRVTSYSYLPCGALWFLCSLFWCRVFFSVWIHSTKNHLFLQRFLIIIFLFLCNYYHFSICAFDSTAVCLPYFALGYYINSYIKVFFTNSNIMILVFLFIFCIASMFFIREHGVWPDGATIEGNPFLAYLRGILGITAIMSIALVLERMNIKFITKYLKYIGEATLTILGLHYIGLLIFKIVYVTCGYPKESVSLLPVIPYSIILCLFCAFIHHEFFAKKYPLIIGKGYKRKND